MFLEKELALLQEYLLLPFAGAVTQILFHIWL